MRRIMLAAMLLLSPAMPSAWAQDPPMGASKAAARGPGPVTMVVEFAIRDYAAWRPVFDAADAEREKAGVTSPRVFRDADLPDRLLVLFKVQTRSKGTLWMKSAAVREAWRKGGVVGEVTHRFMR